MPGKQSVPRVGLEDRKKAIDFIENVVGHELRALRRGDAVGHEIKLIADAFKRNASGSIAVPTQADFSRVA